MLPLLTAPLRDGVRRHANALGGPLSILKRLGWAVHEQDEGHWATYFVRRLGGFRIKHVSAMERPMLGGENHAALASVVHQIIDFEEEHEMEALLTQWPPVLGGRGKLRAILPVPTELLPRTLSAWEAADQCDTLWRRVPVEPGERELLRQVQGDDRAARLVLADWYSERGREAEASLLRFAGFGSHVGESLGALRWLLNRRQPLEGKKLAIGELLPFRPCEILYYGNFPEVAKLVEAGE